ncbi:hypothetical protein OFC13_28975, partial [Escherichia coli]|nr:hypothetical protein [Escherichia coli]
GNDAATSLWFTLFGKRHLGVGGLTPSNLNLFHLLGGSYFATWFSLLFGGGCTGLGMALGSPLLFLCALSWNFLG